jgi:hypothetical protein
MGNAQTEGVNEPWLPKALGTREKHNQQVTTTKPTCLMWRSCP